MELFILTLISWMVTILTVSIIVRAVLSWFGPGMQNGVMWLLMDVTEPILAPMRRIIPTLGMIDISPLIALILLQFLGQFISQIILTVAH